MSLELQHRRLPPCKGYSAGPGHTDTGLGGPYSAGSGHTDKGLQHRVWTHRQEGWFRDSGHIHRVLQYRVLAHRHRDCSTGPRHTDTGGWQ